ncbi:MAG: hypothetical protein IJI14_14005 [Anaerolineaceae bacterium]|nr:hypothetical protein [Anaerolineaceae bacterium]
MKKQRIVFSILSILAGGLFFASFFTEQPLLQTIGAETLLWIERLLAAMLFFTIADTAILQIRKPGNDSGMRIIRTIGFGVFLAVLLLGFIKGPDSSELNRIVFFVQQTMETALAGIVCFSLIFAMYRLPGQAPTAIKISFAAGLIIFLVIYSGLPQMLNSSPEITNITEWIQSIPQGGLMGLLIGIAIGAAITGLRYLFTGKLPSKEDK